MYLASDLFVRASVWDMKNTMKIKTIISAGIYFVKYPRIVTLKLTVTLITYVKN